MSSRTLAVTLLSALCVASMNACTHESRTQAATQGTRGLLALTLDVLGSDKPDGYVVFPELLPNSLQLRTEKLTAYVQSIDGRNFRQSLTRDSTVALPTNQSPLNVPWA